MDAYRSDLDRPLVEAGKEASARIGQFLKTENLAIDLAFCSTAARARETCEIVLQAAETALDVKCEQRIYDGGTPSLLKVISEAEDRQNSVLLVGHNPVLEDLVSVLTGQNVQLSPATLVQITLGLNGWSEIDRAKGQLERVVRPADLPAS